MSFGGSAAGRAVAFSIAIACGSGVAQAQEATRSARQQSAGEISIPAGSLERSLIVLGRQTNLKLVYQTEATDGKRAKAVSAGTVEQALSRLLEGTGLVYVFTAPDTVTIEDLVKTQANSSIELDEINVEGTGGGDQAGFSGYSARRSSSSMKGSASPLETPQAVSSVGAQQITDQGARTVMEALRYSPGVRAEGNGNDVRNDWFRIRGFISQVNSYFLDGLQLQSSTTFATWRVNPYLLERIDILRGPSSALYGAANPGGLVNMISKFPEFRTGGEAVASIDEYGNAWAGVDAQGQNEAGSVAWRVVATGNVGDTEVKQIMNDQFALMPSVTFKPTDDTTITAYASLSKSKTRTQNFLPYEGSVIKAPFGRIPRDLFISDPDLDTFKRTQVTAGYEAEHRFNDQVTFRQNLRYAHLALDSIGLGGGGYVGDPADGILARGNSITTPKLGLFNIDNQLEWKFDTGPLAHTFLFGVDYKRFDLNDEAGYAAGPSLDLLDPVYVNPGRVQTRYDDSETLQRQAGVYVQDRIKIDRLNIVLSGRYDDVRATREDNLTSVTTKSKSDAFSGRAGAIYTFDNGFAPYATIARSFLPLTGVDGLTGAPLKPETGLQYETGVKFAPPSWGGSMLTANVFDLTRENFATSDGRVFNRQIGQARSRGFELEAVGQITPELKMIASYTKFDFKIKEGNPIEIGKVTTATPEQFGGLWLDYTQLTGPLQGLSAGVGVRYVGGSYANNINTLKVPDVTLFDAAIRYKKDQFGVALNVSNIGDKRYVAACSGMNSCFYGAGRRATLTASYAW